MRNLAKALIVFCFGLLVVLIAANDPAQLFDMMWTAPPQHLIAGFALVQIQIIASAYRWRFTAKRLGQDIALSVAVREYYVSSALNLVLPGGMAGDAVRAYRNRTNDKGGWKRPAAAVFLERLSGQVSFFLLCSVGLVLWPFMLNAQSPSLLSVTAVGIGLIVVIAFAVWMARKAHWLPQRLRAYGPDMAAVFWNNGAWLIQIGLSVVITAGYVLTFAIASSAIGASLPASAAFTIIPLCLLTMLIPAGIGGWGTREAAAAALWPLFGFASGQGLAASLLYGLISLGGAALPGIVSIAIAFYAGRVKRA